MQKKKLGDLKKRALLAKQRMKMGYWQEMMRQRDAMLNKEGVNDNYRMVVSEMQRAVIRRDEGKIINSSQVDKDEKLYCKVKEMLDNNEFTANPIGVLVNHEEYDGLDDGAKQRYILELSKKYRMLKERYYKERLSKSDNLL